MSLKKDTAVDSFQSGYNCAQSVLKAFSEDLNLNESQALNMASGFGAGMGRLQETCGAVTGAFMVIGLYNSLAFQLNESRNDITSKMIQEFETRFKTKHGTTACKELLKCDLNTEEGQSMFQEKNLHKKVCQKCITDAVDLLVDVVK